MWPRHVPQYDNQPTISQALLSGLLFSLSFSSLICLETEIFFAFLRFFSLYMCLMKASSMFLCCTCHYPFPFGALSSQSSIVSFHRRIITALAPAASCLPCYVARLCAVLGTGHNLKKRQLCHLAVKPQLCAHILCCDSSACLDQEML